jgi:hypothetical protein
MKYLYYGALFIAFIVLLNVVIAFNKQTDAGATKVEEEYKKSY